MASIKKRILAAALAAFCLTGGALAEVYDGVTVAASIQYVAAQSGGAVADVFAEPGEIVEAGETLTQLRTRKIFAAEDGTVARVLCPEGERTSGAILELAPVSRYTIRCSVDDAYASAQSMRVRTGETLYIRCTANGTHRGTGVITKIDGNEYQVSATAGEFFVGEAVRLYRDADFTAEERVGSGTVLISDVQPYEAEGALVRLHVAEGEFVERGELLFECADGAETELRAPASGIVTEAVEPGANLQAGEAAFAVAPFDQIRVELKLDESAASALEIGDRVELIRADDPDETVLTGAVEFVSRLPENGTYAVRIKPDATIERLGLTVYVRTQG